MSDIQDNTAAKKIGTAAINGHTILSDDGKGNISGVSYAPGAAPPQTDEQAAAAFEAELAVQKAELKERFDNARTDVSIAEAITVIAKAVHADPDYAWSWLCNVAMVARDAGAPPAESNKRAATFLYNFFQYRAWADNAIYMEHIKRCEAAVSLDRPDPIKVNSVGGYHTAPNPAEGVLQVDAATEPAIQAVIDETREMGFTHGAKPGSTAARLGILPVNPNYPTHPVPTPVDTVAVNAAVDAAYRYLSDRGLTDNKLTEEAAEFFEANLQLHGRPDEIRLAKEIVGQSTLFSQRAAEILTAGLDLLNFRKLSQQSA